MAIQIQINGSNYLFPTHVKDITLARHIGIAEVEDAECPDEFRAISEEKDEAMRKKKAARLPKVAYAKKVIPYFAKWISAATDVPLDVLLGRNGHQGAPVAMIEGWYWNLQKAYSNFKTEDAKSEFTINGQRWVLPPVGMAKSTFGEFAEAAQYEDYTADVAGGNWSRMPYVMAVLLRPEGEAFDPEKFDEIVEERAEIMRGQTMDVVYSTAFFLQKRSEVLRIDLAIYTTARTLSTSRQVSKTLPANSDGT